MFTSQREKWADPDIIALVELDIQKMRVRFVLAREAIRERMLELEHPRDHQKPASAHSTAPSPSTGVSQAANAPPQLVHAAEWKDGAQGWP